MFSLPKIIVTNLHQRFTGVSATVKHLYPLQSHNKDMAILDTGELGFGSLNWRDMLFGGWSRTIDNKPRVLHVRRDVEMLLGLLLKWVFRQNWQLVFTSAASKKHSFLLFHLIHKMDAIIATSERSASFLDWHSTIINHGVDVAYFYPGPTQRNNQPFWIGVFGRLRHLKGTDLVVDALIALLPQHPEWQIFFAGLAKDNDFMINMMTKIKHADLEGRFHFLGDLPHDAIIQHYQRCHLVVAASRREGFGLTPLEAMACGVPVVTSRAGFWPELVQPGRNGWLFETGDVEDLKRTMQHAMLDPDQLIEMGKYARQYVVKNHSLQREADQINAFYDTMLTPSFQKKASRASA